MFGRKEKPPEEVGLPDPGVPIILVLKTYLDGTSNIQYKGEPAWAIETLRGVADSIESEISG